jgi:hypothetical protein
VREFEEALGIPGIIVPEIYTENLVKKRVVAKFVPQILSLEQK